MKWIIEKMMSIITPEQTILAAKNAGINQEDLRLPGIAVLTFSRAVVEHFETNCGLKEIEWLAPQHHPYAAPHVVKRGSYKGIGVSVIVPPMGSSPISCIVEDVVLCGAKTIFLVCAAWSLGPPVGFGDIILPSFSMGQDGTSIHYGNYGGKVSPQPQLVDAFVTACKNVDVRFHLGGNGTCEALYRITPSMVADYRAQGCLCMDNGEANTLFAMGKSLGVMTGVIFHPYIDLAEGWNPARLTEASYRTTCQRQAGIVLEASLILTRNGLLDGK
jgi:uridine phosphorylase